jgi:type VI protein secretion system component VasK
MRLIKILSVFAISILALSLLIMLLWNSLVPEIFNGPVISYWQSLGLLLLVRILTFSFRPWTYRNYQRGGYWQKKFEEKLASMPPEQRERIRTICASKCSNWHRKQQAATESAAAG